MCLIHCHAGINRSGVLATAHLMLAERLPVLEAVARVKEVRGNVLCNHSFQSQLVQLARDNGLLGPQPEGRHVSAMRDRKPRRPATEALQRLM